MSYPATARINGYPCGLLKRDSKHGKHVPLLEPIYNAHAVSQDLGPKATSVELRAYVEGADHEAQARRIVANVLSEPFVVVTDTPNVYYDQDHVFVRVPDLPKERRGLELSEVTLQAVLVGNRFSHDLREYVTAGQILNEWGLPGIVAVRIPQGATLQDQALTDAVRRVVQSPTQWAAHEASYAASRRTRNGTSALSSSIDAPTAMWNGQVKAKDVLGGILEGTGNALAQGTVENVAVRILFDAAQDRLTYTDLLYGAASVSLVLDAWGMASHGRVGLPVHGRRHVVQLDNAKRTVVTVLDNGVAQVQPRGGDLTVSPAPGARTYGGGVYWHSLGANAYLVGTHDFAVAAGVVTYGAPSMGAELVANGGMETYPASPGPPSSWTNLAGNSSQLVKDTSVVRSGGVAVKILADGSTATPGLKQTLAGLTVGSQHIVEAWGLTDGQAGSQCQLVVWNVTDATAALTVNGTAGRTFWERLRGSFTPVAGKSYEVRLLNPAAVATEAVWFDDASAKRFLGLGANSTNPTAQFAVVYTNEAGTALDKRLREAFTDLLADWLLEPK